MAGVDEAAGDAVAPDHEFHDRSVNRSGGTHSCYRAVPSWSAHQPRLYTRTDYQPIQRVLEKRTRRASSGSGRGPKGGSMRIADCAGCHPNVPVDFRSTFNSRIQKITGDRV